MEFRDVVRARRSVRAYASEIPPQDVLDTCVDIARRAPSAGFSQGIDFLILDDPDVVASFYRMTTPPDVDLPDSLMDHPPPVVVLVFSDPMRYLRRYSEGDKITFGLDDLDRWPVRFWDVDAAMAAMQFQLAAVDQGLATWFFGIAHGESDVRERFRIPEDRSLVGVIGVGYRHDDEQPIGSGTTRKRRPLGEQLHRNQWGDAE